MSLGSPLFLGLLALSVPIFVFFLSRRKVKQVQVSSVQIYRVLLTNRPTRRSFSTLRHLLALLLTLMALGLLVLALIDLRGSADGPRDFVVVLDTSASMGAVEDGQSASRWERAVDELEGFIRDLNDEDRVALVTSGPAPAVAVGFTRNRARPRVPLRAGRRGRYCLDRGRKLSARRILVPDRLQSPRPGTDVPLFDPWVRSRLPDE